MAITNDQWGEGCSRMETVSSGWCASWLSGTAQAWVLASQGGALIISSSEACINEASVYAELLRGLWPPSELSQRRFIFNTHHHAFGSVAFDAPLPDGDPLLCLGLALDYYISSCLSSVSKPVFIKAYRKLAGCACALKRLPLSTHSLLKRFASSHVVCRVSGSASVPYSEMALAGWNSGPSCPAVWAELFVVLSVFWSKEDFWAAFSSRIISSGV